MVHFDPDVVWSVDCRGLSLVHRKTGDRACLVYPQAALWDLLSREVEMTRIIRIMTALTALRTRLSGYGAAGPSRAGLTRAGCSKTGKPHHDESFPYL